MDAIKQALAKVQSIAGRAFEYGSPALYEDDVVALNDALEDLAAAVEAAS